MWQRFTERARRVVFYAQEEAIRLGEQYVSSEHLLLGIMREPDAVSGRIIRNLGFSFDQIHAVLDPQLTHGGGPVGQDMQLTPRAKMVIDLAYEEAKLLRNNYIGTEHLLLGLIREKDGMAGRVLNGVGLTLEPVRRELLRIQEEAIKARSEQSSPVEPQSEAKSPEIETLPEAGDLGTLQDPEGRPQVEIIVHRDDLDAYAEIMRIRDHYGYQEMATSGKFRVLPAGTELKLLRPEDSSLYVRILSGDEAGQTGWILGDRFHRIGPDITPFPPPLSP